jgi:hypothetical protein
MRPVTGRGFALPTVMVALVILEALLAVAFIAVMTWARAAGWGVADARAREAAEAGLVRASTGPWSPAWDTASGPVVIAADRLPGGATFSTSLLPLGPRTVVLQSEGMIPGSESRVALAGIGTRQPRLPLLPAALTFGGGIDIEGAVVASGHPLDASGWAACGSPAAAADVLALAGEEAVAAFDALPHEVWRPFAIAPPAMLPVSPEPAVVDGRCDASLWSNWGDPLDPLAPCGTHYPIVYYDGALRIAGGRGQGLLVVTGDLTIGGSFAFHGLVAVRGRLIVEEPGASVVGTLLVGWVLGERHAVRGTLAVQYAKCMVEIGLPGSGAAQRLPGPSWFQAYGMP